MQKKQPPIITDSADGRSGASDGRPEGRRGTADHTEHTEGSNPALYERGVQMYQSLDPAALDPAALAERDDYGCGIGKGVLTLR